MKREPLAPTEQGRPTTGDSPGATFSAERNYSTIHDELFGRVALEIAPTDENPFATQSVFLSIHDHPATRPVFAKFCDVMRDLCTVGLTVTIYQPGYDREKRNPGKDWVQPIFGNVLRPDENGEPSTRNGVMSLGRIVERDFSATPN